MKEKGFTIIELLIVVSIIGILVAIAVPNFIKFQCRAVGGDLELNSSLVNEVCSDCIRCDDEGVSPKEALQMIKDGANPSRFVDWQSEEQINLKPESTEPVGKVEFPDRRTPDMRTDKLPEPVRRSWKD